MSGVRFTHTREMTERARQLRKTVSRSEACLWLYLRQSQLGAAFRRQHPIDVYFADYACPSLKLVIEVDGPLHERRKDARRDRIMKMAGWMVLRFSADATACEMEGVLRTIQDAVRLRKWEMQGKT